MRFINFIIKEPQNKRYLLIALAGTTVEFIIFKLLYPFADFFSDSYSYIYAAQANLDINIWPIGYSKFLRIFHFITHSDTALVGFQYFFLELSCLYFFFTALWFYRPGKVSRLVLFVFLFFNPLFLYISNYINSDPLFAALSVLWFTELIWVTQRPKLYHIFTQAILLFLAFTVRHNAMYYPFIGALAFALSRQSLWRKVGGAFLGAALIIPFILFERNAAYKMYGVKQFSPMSGWQLANNALYMYGHLQVDNSRLPTPETRELDTLAKDFYRYIIPGFDQYLTDYVANFFIRRREAPLKGYCRHHYKVNDDYAVIVGYGKASIVFGEFGSWMIRHYPLEFARYFLLRNTKNYFLPPLEKLKVYNLGKNEIWPIAQKWFGYSSLKTKSISLSAQGIVLFLYPPLFLLINLYFVISIFLFFFNIKKLLLRNSSISLILYLSFYLVNASFSIFATINVFRYQFFPLLVLFSFSTIIIERISFKTHNQRKIITEEKYIPQNI